MVRVSTRMQVSFRTLPRTIVGGAAIATQSQHLGVGIVGVGNQYNTRSIAQCKICFTNIISNSSFTPNLSHHSLRLD